MSKFLSKSLLLYKDAYAGHPPEIWTITIVTFINRVGTMIAPFLVVYLTTILDFELKEAGLIVAAFGAGSFSGTYVGGKLTDRIGARKVITGSLLLGGVFLILLQLVTSFWGLVGMLFTMAFFGEALRPATMASIGDYVPKSHTGRAMALLRLAINLGFTAAPAIGGFLAVSLGYAWLFWIDGLTCIAAAIYFVIASAKWRPTTQSDILEENATSKASTARPPHLNRRYILFLLATFIMGFGFIQWFHSIPLFLKSEWGFDERYIGALMMLNGILIVILEMPLVHIIEHKKQTIKSFFIGIVLIGASFLPFLLPAWYGFAVLAIVLMTIGEILNLPFSSSFALNLSPDSMRGEYSAWYGMTWSLTHIAGPALGLAFIDELGYPAFWSCLAVLCIVSLVLHRWAGMRS
ncbi:MAG: MFS transporter [Bacteroidia bacterium]